MVRPGLASAALGAILSVTVAVPAAADPVLEWNVIALKTTAAAAFDPPLESRNLAIVHAAVFDAVNSIDGQFRAYAVQMPGKGASPDAAAIAAAHFALVQLYPAQRAALDEPYKASIAALVDGPAKSMGIALGEAVAAAILNRRSGDGASAAIAAPYTPGSEPGAWVPTPPGFAAALDPGWGQVTPFVLARGSQFRPGPPPALDSARYARDFNEIKGLGSTASAFRTAEQTDLARFWVATGPQIWNLAARQAAAARGLSVVESARLFALLSFAGADAFIAAWDAKFAFHQWRPVTAIRAADTDGNPATEPDSAWTPLLPTPRFPDYVAGHTTYAGAAQKVLEHIFGLDPRIAMTLTSASAPGIVQTYNTFEQIADGVVEARVLGGIHWRTSSERGRLLGEVVGRYAVRHCLGRARSQTAPR